MRIREAHLRLGAAGQLGAVTGTGRELVFGDRPERNEHSPVELVTAALAACSAMDVQAILRKKRQVVDAYRIEVRAVQRDEYPRILTTIDVIHEVTGPKVTEAAVRRSIELSATKYCPVSAMLSMGPTRIRHGYVVRRTGEDAFEISGVAIETGGQT